jgi:ferredoxin/flavodoxin
MATTIFYFTGTGNSLMVSRDLAVELGETKLVSIPKAIHEKEIDLTDERIGFIFPVYFFGIPLIIRDFIKKLKLDNQKYIFCVVNSGGTPGASLEQISKLLIAQGSKLNAGFHIEMPGNYIPMYNPPVDEKCKALFEAEKQKIKEVGKLIKACENTGIEKGKLNFTKVFAPIIYKHSAKFYKDAEKFQVTSKCDGCGICDRVCPVSNIEFNSKKPVWLNKCQQCLACIQWCPQKAIEFGKGTAKRIRYTNPKVKVKDIIDSVQVKNS